MSTIYVYTFGYCNDVFLLLLNDILIKSSSKQSKYREKIAFRIF